MGVIRTRLERVFLWLLLATAAVVGTRAEAQEQASAEGPYIEAGGALIGQYIADYRGSSRYQYKVLPVPYGIYLGRWLKADRGGLRSDFFANSRMELGASLSASLGGDSEGNELRQDMPELGIPFEVGPTLNVNLTGADFREGWALRLPLRGVVAWASGINGVGFLFAPQVSYRTPDAVERWRFSSNIGLTFADRSYHEYFYNVEPRFATVARPAYKASSGYSGAFAELYLYKRFGDTRLAFGVRGDYLGGAAFESSPLVETDTNFSVSFALVRTLWRNRPRKD